MPMSEDLWYEDGGDRHRVVVVEYLDGRPSAVVTEEHWDHTGKPWFRPGRDEPRGTRAAFWDFDYCRRLGILYYRNVGGGGDPLEYTLGSLVTPTPPPGRLWCAPDVRLVASELGTGVPLTNAQVLARGYRRLARPLVLKDWRGGRTRNPFEAGQETEKRLEYCAICQDHLPIDELCQHVFMPSCGEPVGAGSDEPSLEAVFAALDWLRGAPDWRGWPVWGRWEMLGTDPVASIEARLRSGKFRRVPVCSRGMEDVVGEEALEEVEPGLGWLSTLGPDTPKANAQALAWIRKWRRTAKARAAAKERQRLIDALSNRVTSENRPAVLAALGIPGKQRGELDTVPTERLAAVLGQMEGQGAGAAL